MGDEHHSNPFFLPKSEGSQTSLFATVQGGKSLFGGQTHASLGATSHSLFGNQQSKAPSADNGDPLVTKTKKRVTFAEDSSGGPSKRTEHTAVPSDVDQAVHAHTGLVNIFGGEVQTCAPQHTKCTGSVTTVSSHSMVEPSSTYTTVTTTPQSVSAVSPLSYINQATVISSVSTGERRTFYSVLSSNEMPAISSSWYGDSPVGAREVFTEFREGSQSPKAKKCRRSTEQSAGKRLFSSALAAASRNTAHSISDPERSVKPSLIVPADTSAKPPIANAFNTNNTFSNNEAVVSETVTSSTASLVPSATSVHASSHKLDREHSSAVNTGNRSGGNGERGLLGNGRKTFDDTVDNQLQSNALRSIFGGTQLKPVQEGDVKSLSKKSIFGGQMSSDVEAARSDLFGSITTTTSEPRVQLGGSIVRKITCYEPSEVPKVLVLGSRGQGMSKEQVGRIDAKEKYSSHSVKPVSDVSVEEKLHPTCLIAVNIPDKFVNKYILKSHFSKFGKVKKVILSRKSNQASIYFDCYASALKAKMSGRILHPKIPEMMLFFSGNKEKSSSSSPKVTLPRENSKPCLDLEKKNKEVSQTDTSTSLKGNFNAETRVTGIFGNVSKPVVTETLASSSVSSSSSGNSQVQSKTGSLAPSKLTAIDRKEPSSVLSVRTSSATPPPKSRTFLESPKTLGSSESVVDLKAIMVSQAANSSSRVSILDARDRLMRMKLVKEVNVKKAKYLSALCPDMCPEKERYMRDVQLDLSIFEMTDGLLDHRLAVKKFSRSSADKDEPLPHELRPGLVLQMTMDFLIRNIIQRADDDSVQLDVWYNYLWNRTRALRNDIMQQHLVDEYAVRVLEMCTRFHIHCSERLCEEPADLFDYKMNTEHLTKSLQSLKELYQDMSEKNIFFETEPEFRYYELLLDVMDGNIMFKYLTYREAVRSSQEVQFALSVVKSIQTNNFLKFFKLVDRATYLQACLLHKYFQTVRHSAILRIMKAYSDPNKIQLLPIDKVMHLLGFRNKCDLEQFLNVYGLNAVSPQKVKMNKKSFINPASLPPIKRSVDIIESKLCKDLTEIIQGGTLPVNPLDYYVPHNSFDRNGFLNKSAYEAADQLIPLDRDPCSAMVEPYTSVVELISTELDSNTSEGGEMHRADEAAPVEPELDDSWLKNELQKKITEMVQIRMLRRYFTLWRQYLRGEKMSTLADKHRKRIALKYYQIWRSKLAVAAAENEKANVCILRRYFKKWKLEVCKWKEISLLKEQVRFIDKQTVARKYGKIWKAKAQKMKLRRKLLAMQEKRLGRKYILQWSECAQATRLVRVACTHYDKKLLKKYFEKWQVWLDGRYKPVTDKDFPATGNDLLVSEQNKVCGWNYYREFNENLMFDELESLQTEITTTCKKYAIMDKLVQAVTWSALPLKELFQKQINRFGFSDNFFTRCFVYDIVLVEDPDTTLLKWLRIKLDCEEVTDGESPLNHKLTLNSCTGAEHVFIFAEYQIQKYRKRFYSDSTMLLVLCSGENLRLVEKFLSCQEGTPYLVLCVSEKTGFQGNVWFLNTESIRRPSTSEKLLDVVSSLPSRPPRKTLHCKTLHSLASSYIIQNVIGPVAQSVCLRRDFMQTPLCPTVFVQLYNNALMQLIEGLDTSDMKTIWWPPKEIEGKHGLPSSSWNQKDYQTACIALRESTLPPLTSRALVWSNAKSELQSYIYSVIAGFDDVGNKLVAEVKRLLSTTEGNLLSVLDVDDACKIDSYHLNFDAEFPWPLFLTYLVNFKMSLLPELDMYFDPQVLKMYYSPAFWFEALASKVDLEPETKMISLKRKAEEFTDEESQASFKSQKSQLLLDLQEERRSIQEFEKKMEQDIADEEVFLKQYLSLSSVITSSTPPTDHMHMAVHL